MREAEMRRVAGWLLQVLRSPEDRATAERVRSEIREFAAAFPIPAIG